MSYARCAEYARYINHNSVFGSFRDGNWIKYDHRFENMYEKIGQGKRGVGVTSEVLGCVFIDLQEHLIDDIAILVLMFLDPGI